MAATTKATTAQTIAFERGAVADDVFSNLRSRAVLDERLAALAERLRCRYETSRIVPPRCAKVDAREVRMLMSMLTVDELSEAVAEMIATLNH